MEPENRVPFRPGYRSGPETSIPRPPTRGGSHGQGPGPSLGPGTTSSSFPYYRPPFPPADIPSEKVHSRRSNSTAEFTTSATTPPIPIPIPNNRSSLPTISTTYRKPSNSSTNGGSFTDSKIPIFTRPQPTRRTSSSASSIVPTTSSNVNTSTSFNTSAQVKRANPNPSPSPAPIAGPSNSNQPPCLPKLPKTVDEDDPMLDYAPETWIASMIGTSGLLYRFSESLVYKSSVTSREVALMEAAGSLTLRPLTRVLKKGQAPDSPSRGRIKAVIMEFGKKFRPRNIPPERMYEVVVDMFFLLENLHNKCGIVHGSIRPGAFLWGRDGRLKLADFSMARFIEEDPAIWESQEDLEGLVDEMYLTPQRMRKREENLAAARARKISAQEVLGGGMPAPTVFDDYFALAVTLWGIFTGKKPVNHQFNTRNGRESDLSEVKDDLVRPWIKKVLEMAGCELW